MNLMSLKEEQRPGNSCQTPSLEFGFGKPFFTIFVFSKIEKTQFLSRDRRLAAERYEIVLTRAVKDITNIFVLLNC